MLSGKRGREEEEWETGKWRENWKEKKRGEERERDIKEKDGWIKIRENKGGSEKKSKREKGWIKEERGRRESE